MKHSLLNPSPNEASSWTRRRRGGCAFARQRERGACGICAWAGAVAGDGVFAFCDDCDGGDGFADAAAREVVGGDWEMSCAVCGRCDGEYAWLCAKEHRFSPLAGAAAEVAEGDDSLAALHGGGVEKGGTNRSDQDCAVGDTSSGAGAHRSEPRACVVAGRLHGGDGGDAGRHGDAGGELALDEMACGNAAIFVHGRHGRHRNRATFATFRGFS